MFGRQEGTIFLRCLYVSCEISRIPNGCVLIASQFRKKKKIANRYFCVCIWSPSKTMQFQDKNEHWPSCFFKSTWLQSWKEQKQRERKKLKNEPLLKEDKKEFPKFWILFRYLATEIIEINSTPCLTYSSRDHFNWLLTASGILLLSERVIPWMIESVESMTQK